MRLLDQPLASFLVWIIGETVAEVNPTHDDGTLRETNCHQLIFTDTSAMS